MLDCAVIDYIKRSSSLKSGLKMPKCTAGTDKDIFLTDISDTTLKMRLYLKFNSKTSFPADKVIAWFYYN